jgi:hypothetical protein
LESRLYWVPQVRILGPGKAASSILDESGICGIPGPKNGTWGTHFCGWTDVCHPPGNLTTTRMRFAVYPVAYGHL